MTTCESIQADLTAWIDAELSTQSETHVRQHLVQCRRCASEAASLRACVALQKALLPRLAAAGGVDIAAMRSRLRAALQDADAPDATRRGWMPAWIFRPAVLVPAVAGAALVILVRVAGHPSDVLAPLGVVEPPPAVTQATGLFKDYMLLQQLDALEHFDAVETVPLDEEKGAHTG